MKQTRMYVCTLKNLFLVDVVTLFYKDEVKMWIGILTGLYTNATIGFFTNTQDRQYLHQRFYYVKFRLVCLVCEKPE